MAIILFCSAVAGIFIQLAFQQFCTTRLGIILFSGAIFWTLSGPYIFEYANSHFSNTGKFWSITVGGGLAAVILNQVFIYFSISFLMSALYGCVDQQNNWLQNILTNNIVINSLCYAGFVGAGILVRTKSEKQTEPELAKPISAETYLRELTIKNGNISTILAIENIYWIEADDKCISIVGENFKHVLYRSLKSIESELDPKCFVRVHRSTIINKTYLTKLHSVY